MAVPVTKMQRMIMPIGNGHVTVELPWALTDEEMQDVMDCIALMRKTNARVRAKQANAATLPPEMLPRSPGAESALYSALSVENEGETRDADKDRPQSAEAPRV